MANRGGDKSGHHGKYIVGRMQTGSRQTCAIGIRNADRLNASSKSGIGMSSLPGYWRGREDESALKAKRPGDWRPQASLNRSGKARCSQR
jgi:hypothetical protein